MSDNEEKWEGEPSEAEAKVLAAKRERSDQISKLMGSYLLKGYKMLATTCPTCNTILLEEKSSRNLYCVACAEIDSTETAKDDPVLNENAASQKIAESRYKSKTVEAAVKGPAFVAAATAKGDSQPKSIRREVIEEPVIIPKKAYLCYADPTESTTQIGEMDMSIQIIFDTMNKATQELNTTREENPVVLGNYVNLIKDCAEAITSLRRAMLSVSE
uniref:Sjoegren syndrome/scleroderma autoantigen 1 homolog n=1 Tax=Caligus clemensi TaxID=344056 RepID=C1C2R3_CALCM|nr:Sjoegren syndrome/scleroderma autoantigen 1 homolog [Caligus clemensi]